MYRPDCQSILFFWLTKQQEKGPIVTAVDLHETRENRYPGSVERLTKINSNATEQNKIQCSTVFNPYENKV